MKHISFYVCPVCGAVITTFKADAQLTCCGQPLTKLESHKENNPKHTPVVAVNVNDDYSVRVKVGEIPHPMEKAHFIQFVAYVTLDKVRIKELYAEQDPSAVFSYEGSGMVYEYCNLHGLWEAPVK